MSAERLQKVLAGAGVASRRDCEDLIAAGRVTVNGRVVHELGTRVDLEQDLVAVDGKPVRQPDERTYILLHKPIGVVSTVDDPQGRPVVVDLVDVPARVFPVGRLDVDSEGLLLLTDDGELTHRLTHPSFAVEKEYRVLLDRAPDASTLREWRTGVMLDGERTAPAWVELVERGEEGYWLRVVLQEGRKRQIREVARLLGYTVLRLVRVREGNLQLGDLAPGQWRRLSAAEVQELRTHVDLFASEPAAPVARDDNAPAPTRPRRAASTRAQPAPETDQKPNMPSGPRRDEGNPAYRERGSSTERRSYRGQAGNDRAPRSSPRDGDQRKRSSYDDARSSRSRSPGDYGREQGKGGPQRRSASPRNEGDPYRERDGRQSGWERSRRPNERSSQSEGRSYERRRDQPGRDERRPYDRNDDRARGNARPGERRDEQPAYGNRRADSSSRSPLRSGTRRYEGNTPESQRGPRASDGNRAARAPYNRGREEEPIRDTGNERPRTQRTAPEEKPAPGRVWRERQDEAMQRRRERTTGTQSARSGRTSFRSRAGGRPNFPMRPRTKEDEEE